jgi:cell division protein FtsB
LRWWNLLLLVILLGLQFRLWYGAGSVAEIASIRTAAEQVRLQASAAIDRNQRLAADVQDLKEGLDAIEERARSELGMIGNDETFFQVID